MWITGETLAVVKKDLTIQNLTEKEANIYKNIQQVGTDNVWIVKGKDVQIWDKNSYKMIKEFKEVAKKVRLHKLRVIFKISDIIPIDGDVWIPGSSGGTGGVVQVINSTTFEQHTLSEHKSNVYHAAKIADFVWTSAWDCSIIGYDPKVLVFQVWPNFFF